MLMNNSQHMFKKTVDFTLILMFSTLVMINGCPGGWKDHVGSCYFFGTTSMNHNDALIYCNNKLGYLVMIQSSKENEYLKAVVNSTGVHHWIGATDEGHEGQFRWSATNQNVTYTDWAKSEPSNGGAHAENCVHFKAPSFKWNDISCNGFSRPICELRSCYSQPCKNRATCVDHGNSYTCLCDEDYTGYNCETDMCKPVGADIVFVLDTSYSQSQELVNKQRDYIKKYVNTLPIGTNDFQISVVTFSNLPTILFYLNTFNSNKSISAAVNTIQHEDGPTYLGKALQLVRDNILTPKHGSRSVKTYVIVITDGLLSDRLEAIANGDKLKQDNIDVITVTVGVQILHNDLMKISNTGHVFPLTRNDVLQSILISSVMPECPDCSRYSSDVAIFLDASSKPTFRQFYMQIETVRSLLKAASISKTGVHVSYTRFADQVYPEFDFEEHTDHDHAIPAIATPPRLSRFDSLPNVSRVLSYAINNSFSSASKHRRDARKIVVLFTDGQFFDYQNVESLADLLKSSGVILVTIGLGHETNMTSLSRVASDPAYMFVVGEDVYTSTDVVKSLVGQLIFNVCDFD